VPTAELSRRVEAAGEHPPLLTLTSEQRERFDAAFAEAESFEDLPGHWRFVIEQAERNARGHEEFADQPAPENLPPERTAELVEQAFLYAMDRGGHGDVGDDHLTQATARMEYAIGALCGLCRRDGVGVVLFTLGGLSEDPLRFLASCLVQALADTGFTVDLPAAEMVVAAAER
jgi:hypothetical protein